MVKCTEVYLNTTIFLLLLPLSALASADTTFRCCADLTTKPTSPAETNPVCLQGTIEASYSSYPVDNPANAYSLSCLTDDTGGAYMLTPTNDVCRPGDVVSIEGSAVYEDHIGHFVVRPTKLTLVNRTEPRPPIRTTLPETLSGTLNFHRVRVDGQVIDAFEDNLDSRWNWLLISDNNAVVPLAVRRTRTSQNLLDTFLGARISTIGICTPSTGLRRFLGTIVRVGSPEDLRIVSRETRDLYDYPLLSPVAPTESMARRRLVGTVLASWGERQAFVLPPEGDSIEVIFRSDIRPPQAGDCVELSGLTETDVFNRRLIQAVWRPKPDVQPRVLPAMDISPREIFTNASGESRVKPRLHGRVLRLRGVATGTPTALSGRNWMHLDCHGYIVPVDISALDGTAVDIAEKTELSVTGACLMEFYNATHTAGLPRINGFSLVVRNADDLVTIGAPPFWTPRKLIPIIGLLVLSLAVILLWNLTLRHIAERRGRELFRENVARVSADLRTEERTRLAVDLHDSLAQMLTGVSFQIDAGEFAIASKTLKSCRDELRNCLWDLRNQTLEEKDMGEAIRLTLRPHLGDAAARIRFNVPRAKLSDTTAHAVLMIVRELVSNAVRHGKARTIRIAGGLDGDTLMISVRDDGAGFDPARRPGPAEGHFGLQGIRERVKRCDGAILIDSTPGKGTKVTISLKRQK